RLVDARRRGAGAAPGGALALSRPGARGDAGGRYPDDISRAPGTHDARRPDHGGRPPDVGRSGGGRRPPPAARPPPQPPRPPPPPRPRRPPPRGLLGASAGG